MSDSILCTREKAVATVTINRPEFRNALNISALKELCDCLSVLAKDDEVRVVVLTGAGDKAFCSGMDLLEMVDEGADRSLIGTAIQALYSLGKPTLAKVKGYALAGGMGLALACDLVVADESAIFGLPEINVGLWPYMVTVPLLHTMAPKTVLELMMTGRRLDAQTAYELGAVQYVCKTNELDSRVAEIAQELATKPQDALRLGREAFYHVLDSELESKLTYLHSALENALTTNEAKEGISAFREKRSPQWP